MILNLKQFMKKDDPAPEAEFDISVFEIPPAAAYFETIQQLQKVNAKLDILLRNQSEIQAKLNDTEPESEHEESLRRIAVRYETLLIRYFEGTDMDPEALRNTIHLEDRAEETEEENPSGYRHKPVL